MKEKVLLSIIFALCSYNSCGFNPNRIAWIEERFANSIINNGIIHNEFLFPVEGFLCINDKLYIQTYGGELNRIRSKKTDEGYMITNFEFLINLQIWPEWLVEKYSKSRIFYNIEGDKITINIKGPHIKEEYCYISNIGGSKYGSILEIKGWLLDLLLAKEAEPWPQSDHGVGSTDHFTTETSSNGTSTTYTYDALGRLSSTRENAVDNKGGSRGQVLDPSSNKRQ